MSKGYALESGWDSFYIEDGRRQALPRKKLDNLGDQLKSTKTGRLPAAPGKLTRLVNAQLDS